MDVSVIIVSYNKLHLLEQCLRTLYSNTSGLIFEAIVVDNNSSEQGLDDIVSGYDNLTLVKNDKNLGFAAANNIGLKLARGKYVLFLNNDTVFLENTLKTVYDFAEKRGEDVFVGCRLLNPDRSYQESAMRFPSLWNIFTESFFLAQVLKNSPIFNKSAASFVETSQPLQVDVIRGAFMFCSRDAVMKLGGFDERFYFFGEEVDLCYRFKNNYGGEVWFLPACSIIHIGGATVRELGKFYHRNIFIGKIQYLQKHFKNIRFFLAVATIITGNLLRVILNVFLALAKLDGHYLKRAYLFLYEQTQYPRNRFKVEHEAATKDID